MEQLYINLRLKNNTLKIKIVKAHFFMTAYFFESSVEMEMEKFQDFLKNRSYFSYQFT